MTPPRNRSSDFSSAHPVWATFNNALYQALPTLLAAGILAVLGGSYKVVTSVSDLNTIVLALTDKIKDHDSDMEWLRTEIGSLRSELNEQKFELALLRIGINAPIKPVKPRDGSK